MTLSLSPDSSIEVKGRFHRSVQLERDWHEGRNLAGYLITPTVQELTTRLVSELSQPQGVRAWSITGPYGTGKSSFALFLSKLFAGQLEDVNVPFSADEAVERPLLPVLLVGHRTSLKPALLSSLAGSVEEVAPQLAKSLKKQVRSSELTDAQVVSAFEEATQAAQAAGYGGVLVVLDEFGKFLEYTASNLESEDLLVMQSLAEAAARSETPLVLITILHTGFAEYLDTVDEVQRSEWQKVQGRFTDVAFQEPPEQLLKLVGNALVTDFPDELVSAYRQIIREALTSKALSESAQRLPLAELLPSCAPFHPLTALLLWPLFRSKLAQNERSLFSFLTSREPSGFQEFLATADWGKDVPLFRLHHLYDYVRNSLGTGAYRGDAGRRWVELDDALYRVGSDAPPATPAVVKTLGLLWMYGNAVGLRATEEAIALAINDTQGAREALRYLERRSVVVYRKFEEAYGLWEGSDVDLDAHYADARQQIGQGDLARRLKRIVDLRPYVARSHYIRTGTLRFFDVDAIDGSETALEEVFEHFGDVRGDGSVTYVLSSSVSERQNLIALGQSLSAESGHDQLIILSFPHVMTGLEEALTEVECWRWVRENTPALQHDRVAKKELGARLQHAQQRLEDIAGRVLGLRGYRFEPQSSDWIHGGAAQPLEDARDFTQWLSKLCDHTFDQAPPLHNELLNRDKLSSSAKAALNRLAKAMVNSEDRYRFDIEGTPAEVSMYEAMLHEGGFHRQGESAWWLGKPEQEWEPIWDAVLRFLSTTHTGRRPLNELYALLKRPPYGMRDGPLPLLLCAILLANKSDVVLYYNGLFQPELYDEVLELLIRLPESFEIQQIALTDESRATLDAISNVLRGLDLFGSEPDNSPLLGAVRPLVVAVAKLPPYSKNTRRLTPPEAAELRDAALNAKDPRALLLNDIPRVLGVLPETTEARRELAEKLQASLVALQHAYPSLLDQIEAQIKQTFDLEGTSAHELKAELTERALPLKGYAADQSLALFIDATSRQVERDWRESVARATLRGKPATTWNDNDVVEFQMRLRQLASDFMRLEELVAEKQETGADQVIRVGILGDSLNEARQTITLHSDRMPNVKKTADKIMKILTELEEDTDSSSSARVNLAALAQVVMHYLQAERSDTHD